MNPEIDTRSNPDGIRWGVYFAQTDCGKYIKIGLSYKPGARIRALRYQSMRLFGCEASYLGIVEANPQFENTLHAHFEAIRHKNEWFRSTPELLEYIESLRPHFKPTVHFCYQKLRIRPTLWHEYAAHLQGLVAA